MTNKEKNERIKAVEEQMAKLQKELEDIRKTVTTPEWDFSDWNNAPLRKKYEFDIPANVFIIAPFNEKIDALTKLMKFKFQSGKYGISYNFKTKILGVVYFSSEEIAQKCADWLNAGCPGYLEEE